MDYRKLETVPVLQIVHVSDMHLIHPDSQKAKKTKAQHRLHFAFEKFKNILPSRIRPYWSEISQTAESLRAVLSSGFDGHDNSSIEELIEWFGRVRGDEVWSNTPTWLIDTGDQTTFGDDESLDYGLQILGKLSAALGGVPYTRIHGNHDAWPGKHPLISNKKQREKHKQKLRRKHFIADYPSMPQLSHKIPELDCTIDVYSLNSVVHSWLKNGLARGEIKEDKFWQKRTKARDGVQISALEELAKSRTPNCLRLVLSHHPINLEYPHVLKYLSSKFTMGLSKAGKISNALSKAKETLGSQPLAHLILSGHTHKLYPEIGGCSNVEITSDEGYLHQLVIGTSAKLNSVTSQGIEKPPTIAELRKFDQVFTNQVQLLRISRPTNSDERLLAIDRIVAGRVMNFGPWKICQGPEGGGALERFWVKY